MSIYKDKKGQTRKWLEEEIDYVVRDVMEIRKGESVDNDLIDQVCFDIVNRLVDDLDKDFDINVSND